MSASWAAVWQTSSLCLTHLWWSLNEQSEQWERSVNSQHGAVRSEYSRAFSLSPSVCSLFSFLRLCSDNGWSVIMEVFLSLLSLRSIQPHQSLRPSVLYIPPFLPLQLVFLSSPSIIWSFLPPPLSLFSLSATFDPSFSFNLHLLDFLFFHGRRVLLCLLGDSSSPPPPHLSLPPFFSSPFSLHSTVSSESGTDSISIESPRRPTPSPFPLLLSALMAFCCVFFGLCSVFCTSFLCDFHTPPL